MTIICRGLAEDPTRYVVENMRAIDHKEIYALRPSSDTEQVVQDVLWAGEQKGLSFTYFTDAGEPVSVMGYKELWPGVANVWCFGTDKWPTAVKSMTKIVRRVIVPSLVSGGYHRAECKALTERADTARWLPMLGMKCEAVLAGFGTQREDFSLYVWRPNHVFRRQRQQREEGAQVPEEAGCRCSGEGSRAQSAA